MKEIIRKKTEEIFIDSSSNFWDDLKERINAPFFISFILSWCFINWKVLVLLFWYSNAEIYADKKVYRIEAISNELCWLYSFFWPLFATVIYIFIYPYVREYLRSYNAGIKTKGNQWINKVSKDESFQIRNYFKVKNLYNDKIKELEDQRIEEAIFKVDRDKWEKAKILNQEYIDGLKATIKSELLANDSLRASTKIENFIGTWQMYSTEVDQLVETPHQIVVTKDNLELRFEINGVIDVTICKIQSYAHDPFKEEIIIYSLKTPSPLNAFEILILSMKKQGSAWYGNFFVNREYQNFFIYQKFWFHKKTEPEPEF